MPSLLSCATIYKYVSSGPNIKVQMCIPKNKKQQHNKMYGINFYFKIELFMRNVCCTTNMQFNYIIEAV